jgi:flagellar biosynthesis chaperone FliJ
MRYEDKINMLLDTIERLIAQMKDGVDSQSLQNVANIIPQLELKVENIRNLIELEEQN